jgi:hypothetical protein
LELTGDPAAETDDDAIGEAARRGGTAGEVVLGIFPIVGRAATREGEREANGDETQEGCALNK